MWTPRIPENLRKEVLDLIENNPERKYYSQRMDRNINGCPSVTKGENSKNMIEELEERLDKYCEKLGMDIAFSEDDELIKETQDNIELIKKALNLYHKDRDKATDQIGIILNKYVDDQFFVTELGRCYGMRGMAYYDELHDPTTDYEESKDHPLTLYRARISNHKLCKREDMLHRPFKKNEKICAKQRFICEGMPALYLATTSYACWLELGKPENDFYVSSFIPNNKGERLKVLNMVVTQDMINGFYNEVMDKDDLRRKEIQNKMISFFPLVIATSFKYSEGNKEEYIIPELVMRCLRRFNIDGIIYLSKNLEHDIQLHSVINVVLPIYKDQLQDEYGKITRFFKISKPELFMPQSNKYETARIGSFFNDNFHENKQQSSYEPTITIEDQEMIYGETVFCHFDNYLCELDHAYIG